MNRCIPFSFKMHPYPPEMPECCIWLNENGYKRFSKGEGKPFTVNGR